jgi:glycerol-3-phosphate dehydrogenase
MYDLTGGWRIGERHREVTKQQALAHLPTLSTDHLVAGFLYFDARADDARLTLAVARTAAIEFGAVVANYTPVVRLSTGSDGSADGAVVRPVPGDESSEFQIRARIVVNASGVWADSVRALDEGRDPHAIRPAKGVHVTVPASRLPCDIAAVIPVPKDKRSIFVVSWPETDLVYLGTTDTDYTGPLDDPACTPEDVDYLLDAANAITDSHLTRADVTGVWAGLRPLLAPPEKGGHVSERTADLSRRHTVSTSTHGVVTVTGGKLTTYRKMAQDTVDAVVTRLGESPHRRRCVTKSLPLLGATTKTRDPVTLAQPHARLLQRYGTAADDVLVLAEGRADLLEPMIEGLPYTGAEALYAVREEMAGSLDDVLSRRTRATIQRALPAMDAAEAVATLIAPDMGWDESAVREQVARYSEASQKELLTAGLDLP